MSIRISQSFSPDEIDVLQQLVEAASGGSTIELSHAQTLLQESAGRNVARKILAMRGRVLALVKKANEEKGA